VRVVAVQARVYRIAGRRYFSSRAAYADWGLLLARSDPDVAKHAGITAFGLDMHAPGVTVRPLRQMNGDTHFSEVFLDDVAVPDGDRIGEPGTGWGVAISTLAHERASIGGGWGTITRAQLVALARDRDPVTRHRITGAAVELEISRMANLRAKAAASTGRPPGPEGSGAKLRNSEQLRRLSDVALDSLGADAMVGAGEWHTLFLTGPSFRIRGGTDEIQRNILGERVLGLPREPR